MQAERVGRVTTDFGRTVERPIEIGLHLGNAVAEIKSRLCAGARGIFPFGLCQKAIFLCRLSGKPSDIFLRVVPGYEDHRVAPAAPGFVTGLVLATAICDTCIPLRKR